jgi:magnesium transporter
VSGDRTRTRAYRGGKLVAEGFPLEEAGRWLAEPGTQLWLDLLAPTAERLRGLPDELGLHELAIRNALRPERRPQVTRYPTYVLLDLVTIQVDPAGPTLALAELAALVTPRALITVRPDERFDLDAVAARWDELAGAAAGGMGLLVYGLLVEVAESHLAAVRALDDSIEQVEGLLFEEDRPHPAEVQRRAYGLRRVLLKLRHLVVPMQEVVTGMMRWESREAERDALPYLQDVYALALRAAEWTETQRELVTAILDSTLTVQSNQLNLIMKRVTGWAAIIAVPTAITGFYGMNVPFPGFGTAIGFVVAVTALVLTSVGLYVLFKQRDWL